MKRKLLNIMFCLMAIVANFSICACSDDEPDEEDYRMTYLSDTYTPTSTAKLEATYNGVAVTDANAKVTLKTPDNTVGTFDINGIVADMAKVQISNVPMTFNEDNYHFEFSGSATTNGKTVKISGYVTYHLLVIDITDK